MTCSVSRLSRQVLYGQVLYGQVPCGQVPCGAVVVRRPVGRRVVVGGRRDVHGGGECGKGRVVCVNAGLSLAGGSQT